MKVKYKVINDLLMQEEDCIAYLEKMALKGWQLEKIGTTFFKFRRQEPKQLKYQFDYNPLTDDYLDLIAMEGYQFIDNFRQLSIFVTENYNAQDLQSDKITKLMVKKKLFPIKNSIILIFCALFMYVISTMINGYQKSSWGHFFVETDKYIIRYLLILLAVMLLVDAVSQILIRYNINLEANDKKDIRKIIKFVLKLEIVVLIAMIPLLLFFIIETLILRPLNLVKYGIMLILYIGFGYFVNKKVFHETHRANYRLKMFLAFAVYIVVATIYLEVISTQKIEGPLAGYPNENNNEIYGKESPFVKITSIYGGYRQESDKGFIEVKYTCINNDVAKAVFEYKIRDTDQQIRIPSDEEINRIVEKTGRWSIDDVEYLSFQKASNNLIKYDSPLVDECYYGDNIYIAIKDDVVLKVIVSDKIEIDEVLEYYLVIDKGD